MVARVLGPGSVISKDLARRGPSSAVSTSRRSWLPPGTASHILWRHPQGSLQHNHRIGRGLPQNLPASLSCPPRLGRRSRTALPTQRDSSHSGWRAVGRSLLWHWQRSSCKTGQRKWPSQRRVILPMNGQVPLENTTGTRSQQAWSSGDLRPTPQLSSRGPCPGPSFARGKGPGVGPGWLWPWSGGPRCRRGLRSRAGRQSTRYTFWRCPAASEKWIAWDCQAPTVFFMCGDYFWFLLILLKRFKFQCDVSEKHFVLPCEPVLTFETCVCVSGNKTTILHKRCHHASMDGLTAGEIERNHGLNVFRGSCRFPEYYLFGMFALKLKQSCCIWSCSVTA